MEEKEPFPFSDPGEDPLKEQINWVIARLLELRGMPTPPPDSLAILLAIRDSIEIANDKRQRFKKKPKHDLPNGIDLSEEQKKEIAKLDEQLGVKNARSIVRTDSGT